MLSGVDTNTSVQVLHYRTYKASLSKAPVLLRSVISDSTATAGEVRQVEMLRIRNVATRSCF